MKNIDKMKRNIIEQIENMTVEQFEDFADMLTEYYNFRKNLIDMSNIFRCSDCKKVYGKCPENTYDNQICTDRFRDYAMKEEQNENNKI